VLRSTQERASATTPLADRGAMLTVYADGGCGYAATRISLPQGFKRARTGDRAGPARPGRSPAIGIRDAVPSVLPE
jgi:hypothetical protein